MNHRTRPVHISHPEIDPDTAIADERQTERLGTFGMWLFLAALGMLFGSSLVGYLIIRARIDSPALAETLQHTVGAWASTILLLLSSVTMHLGLRAAREDRPRQLRFWLSATTFLALAFLVNQIPNLLQLIDAHEAGMVSRMALFGLIFFLVVVHAAHVLGGLGALLVITWRAFQGRYRRSWLGIKYTTMYWHFLDVVWLVMFAVIYLVA